ATVFARAGTLRADATDEDLLPWRRALYRALLFRDIDEIATAPGERRVERPEVDVALEGRSGVAWRRDPGGARLLLAAAVPLRAGDGAIRGALLLERTNSEVLLLTDRAFSRLLAVT